MNIIKSAARQVLSLRMLIPSSSRVIFLYHDVSSARSPQYSALYSTDPQIFRSQISFIARHFKIVPLEELLGAADLPSRSAAITFDDGFLSVKQAALPMLAAQGIPFAVFLNSTAIEENYLPYDQYDEINRRYTERVFLDPSDVKQLRAAGVTIGSHTANHRTLSRCGQRELHEEVAENKRYLESLIGEDVVHLALPYGKPEHYNEHCLRYCRAAGHRFIYSTNPTFFRRPWPAEELTPTPRIGLTNQSARDICFLVNRPMLTKVDI